MVFWGEEGGHRSGGRAQRVQCGGRGLEGDGVRDRGLGVAFQVKKLAVMSG